MVSLALAAPVAMVETSVTPMSRAVPVAAMRRGFFWMLPCAIVAEGPVSATSAPMPFISAGSQKTAVTAMPRNASAAPAIASSRIIEYSSLCAVCPPFVACTRHTANTAIAMPTAMSRRPRTARRMPAFLVSVSSIGRNASSGVTAVAERAEPREASTVMTTPKAIGTAKTCQEKMTRML